MINTTSSSVARTGLATMVMIKMKVICFDSTILVKVMEVTCGMCLESVGRAMI